MFSIKRLWDKDSEDHLSSTPIWVTLSKKVTSLNFSFFILALSYVI